MTTYKGTYAPNRRNVVATAPDCLVYINGELSLPSGATPYRRVHIQPLIHSVNVSLSRQGGSGSANIDLHIPRHYLSDLYVAGQLTLTTMMEVKIYMKGHFTVGGAPQYYPVFWGIVTSISESYSGGEQTVSLSCNDILYWWEIQQISINPSWLASRADQQLNFNLEGNFFAGKNPFSIMYTLARQVYGDSMNMNNLSLANQDVRSEAPSGDESRRLMAYWSARWGRIANSLRMYGPTGQVLQGDLLSFAIDPKRFLNSKKGQAAKRDPTFYEPFQQGDVDFTDIHPFALIFSQLGNVQLTSSEFETKLNVANQIKDVIGYEFFMDATGELIFKPPFYNLDVRPNFPVSWIRDIDVINWSFAENPPDVTFIEATGFRFKNQQVGLSEEVQPKATYVDYRLVQKFGWKPGSFSSNYIGSDELGGPRALFYHLVDILDQQNARVNNGSVSIPLRPEMRLGYPVYIEGKDAYYYVDSIQHSFSYGSRCTTTLSLMARRQKFYADFPRWNGGTEPKPGDVADPSNIPRNLYRRSVNPATGTPEGDRNVILKYVPERDIDVGQVETFEEQGGSDDTEVLRQNIVNLRSQFGVRGPNKYFYVVDPNRDTQYESNETGDRQAGPITHIEAESFRDTDTQGRNIQVNAAIFPVSDERGYEVVGTYEYGRRVTVGSKGFVFDRTEDDIRVEGLLYLEPDGVQGDVMVPNIPENRDYAPSTHRANAASDERFLVDPNNYGRLLGDIRPPNFQSATLPPQASGAVPQIRHTEDGPATPTQEGTLLPNSTTAQSDRGLVFQYNSNVAQWSPNISNVRDSLGLSEEDYPTSFLLSIIHVESRGNANARRTNNNGRPSQFVGLMQVGKSNAEEFGRTNTDFLGDADLSIQHFLQYMEKYRVRHNNDPVKMALLWKGGPGTLRLYNDLERSGATAQELENWLANYPPNSDPWNVDEYLSRANAAQQVWESVLEESQPMITTPEEIERDLTFEFDEALDENLRDIINDVGFPEETEIQTQVRRFSEALEDNVNAGIYAMPTSIKPPRDISIVPVINQFLEELYRKAFRGIKDKEKILRGEIRQIPRLPTVADLPTGSPDQKEFVNTPLGRREIQEALDRGETVDSLFREGGPVSTLETNFRTRNFPQGGSGDDE
jgi:hypothetical protein